MMNNNKNTTFECAQAYNEYCNNKGVMNFVGYFGTCPHCGKSLFREQDAEKIRNGSEYITGCPHCHRSLCD